ncbi:hypothetical protein GCM10023331_29690 [Algivirga pacifica]|uniref:Uncharacterized protein n=2 Tax=Algivirga pacifica TaxID=1162670 RepID=A0ABP9DIP7_9BACT
MGILSPAVAQEEVPMPPRKTAGFLKAIGDFRGGTISDRKIRRKEAQSRLKNQEVVNDKKSENRKERRKATVERQANGNKGGENVYPMGFFRSVNANELKKEKGMAVRGDRKARRKEVVTRQLKGNKGEGRSYPRGFFRSVNANNLRSGEGPQVVSRRYYRDKMARILRQNQGRKLMTRKERKAQLARQMQDKTLFVEMEKRSDRRRRVAKMTDAFNPHYVRMSYRLHFMRDTFIYTGIGRNNQLKTRKQFGFFWVKQRYHPMQKPLKKKRKRLYPEYDRKEAGIWELPEPTRAPSTMDAGGEEQ